MDSIGSTLRCERLRRGLRLEQITEWTKICQNHLQAMEEDHFDCLPGGLFNRSFLRQYARILDLDEEQLVAAFKEQYEPPLQPEPVPAPPRQSLQLPWMHPFGWLVVAVLFGGGVYTVWENVRRSMPESRTAAGPAAPAPSQSGAMRARQSALDQSPAVMAQTSRNLSAGAGGVVRVVFSATEPVWISIKSDGNHFYSGTLEGQEKKELEAMAKVTALIGNAGGLDVSLNGERIGPLGQHGQVRLLELTPSGARVVDRPPATGADGQDQHRLSAERQL